MTKRLVLAMLILGVAAFAVPPAVADGHDEGGSDAKFDFWFKSRIRWENLNNYTDFEDTISDDSDRQDFWATRTQFGFKAGLADDVWFKMDVQNIGSFGNIDPIRTTQDPLYQSLPNSGYYCNGICTYSGKSDTSIYQAYVALKEIGGSKFSLKVGRQEFYFSDGLILGNEPFYGGITFDGLTGYYAFDNWKLGAFYLKTAERNDPGSDFQPQFGDASYYGGNDDDDLYGGYAKLRFKEDDHQQNLEVYAMMRQMRSFDDNHLEEMVFGGAYYRHVKTMEQAKANPMSWKAEFAIQSGEEDVFAGEEDFDGWIFDGWWGWNFVSGDTIHTAFLGAFMTPGDDDQTDDDYTGWSPLYPTEHGRLGETDWFDQGFGGFGPGMTAYKFGWKMMSGKHKAYAQFWTFQPTEDSIQINPTTTVDIEDFGTEIDLGYSYAYTDNVKVFFTAAQLSPDDGLTGGAGAPDDAVTRFYGGIYLTSF